MSAGRFLLIAGLAVSASAAAEVSADFDVSVADRVIIGKSTRYDVEGLLGRPDDVTARGPRMRSLLYEYRGPDAPRQKSKRLLFTIDKDEIVREIKVQQGESR